MSGYASKREAMDVLKHTIASGWNSKAPSDDPQDYFMEKVFRETFYSRGRGNGWGQILDEENTERFHVVLARGLRPKARERLIRRERERQGRFYDMAHGLTELDEGLTLRDARDLYESARDRVALMKGEGA